MADLWSDYTDALLKDIDKSIGEKYDVQIRELLGNLPKYTAKQNIGITISNMKEDANNYIDNALKDMPNETRALDDSMSRVSAITAQLSQNISMQTRQHNVPFIRPLDIIRSTGSDEEIQINTVDDQLMRLVEKMVESSNMVADFSYTFKDYKIGSWLFDRNQKNYILTVFVPQNDALDLENGRQELNDLFDSAANFVRG